MSSENTAFADFEHLANTTFKKKKYVEIFNLLYDGYSYSEVANQMNYTYKNFKVIVSRITIRFKEENAYYYIEHWSKGKSRNQTKLNYCQQFFGKYKKVLSYLFISTYSYHETIEEITLGKAIKNARLIKGLSLNDLCELASIRYSVLVRYESDSSHPRVSTLKRIELVLNLEPTTLTQYLVKEISKSTRGGRIKYYRTLAGYSREEFADVLNTSAGYIRNMEENYATCINIYEQAEKALALKPYYRSKQVIKKPKKKEK